MKKLVLSFLIGGGAFLIWRSLTNAERGINDGENVGIVGGFIDAAYGLGDAVYGAIGEGMNDNLSVSLRGLAFVKGWEELRLMPYFATPEEKERGILTIGYGHTYKKTDFLKVEKYANGITKAQAESLFLDDINEREETVRRLVKVRLNQNQFDALVSFVMNTGRLSGTTLLKKLNGSDYSGAGNELMRWVYQGKKVLSGLYKRRSAESQIWFNNFYNSAH